MTPEPNTTDAINDEIIKMGTLRKSRSWNKRFFVLRKTSPPTLEYYDSERKYKTGKLKRSFPIEFPWAVVRKGDKKQHHQIEIFTEDSSFAFACESRAVQDDWYIALENVIKPVYGNLKYSGLWCCEVDNHRFEHESSYIPLNGKFRVCLTRDTISIIKALPCGGADPNSKSVEIKSSSIKSIVKFSDSVELHLGRSCGFGHGILILKPGDSRVTKDLALKLSRRINSNIKNGNSSNSLSRRNHANNLPPSIIGLAPTYHLNNRSRCQSLPAKQVQLPYQKDPGGIRNNRINSEGQPLRRPPQTQLNSDRSYANIPARNVQTTVQNSPQQAKNFSANNSMSFINTTSDQFCPGSIISDRYEHPISILSSGVTSFQLDGDSSANNSLSSTPPISSYASARKKETVPPPPDFEPDVLIKGCLKIENYATSDSFESIVNTRKQNGDVNKDSESLILYKNQSTTEKVSDLTADNLQQKNLHKSEVSKTFLNNQRRNLKSNSFNLITNRIFSYIKPASATSAALTNRRTTSPEIPVPTGYVPMGPAIVKSGTLRVRSKPRKIVYNRRSSLVFDTFHRRSSQSSSSNLSSYNDKSSLGSSSSSNHCNQVVSKSSEDDYLKMFPLDSSKVKNFNQQNVSFGSSRPPQYPHQRINVNSGKYLKTSKNVSEKNTVLHSNIMK